MNKLDEEVLVVSAQLLDRLGSFSGFTSEVGRYLPHLLDKANQSFVARRVCEDDPSLKQLIPYVLLVDRYDRNRWFRYARGSGQTESRLHAMLSLGIGGHINREDAVGEDLYRSGMQRELEEEMVIAGTSDEQIVGLIYDPDTAVGQVHLGIVHVIGVDASLTRNREDDMHECGFVDIDDIAARYDQLERWSQLAFDAVVGRRP